MFCGPAWRWFRLFVLKKVCVTFICTLCHPPGDSDSESVTIAFWLHLPTQRYIGCHGFTKSLQTQMAQTHIPSFIHFFLMKTQEWKDCYVYRNIGIRGSNAKYETGIKELKVEGTVFVGTDLNFEIMFDSDHSYINFGNHTLSPNDIPAHKIYSLSLTLQTATWTLYIYSVCNKIPAYQFFCKNVEQFRKYGTTITFDDFDSVQTLIGNLGRP